MVWASNMEIQVVWPWNFCRLCFLAIWEKYSIKHALRQWTRNLHNLIIYCLLIDFNLMSMKSVDDDFLIDTEERWSIGNKSCASARFANQSMELLACMIGKKDNRRFFNKAYFSHEQIPFSLTTSWHSRFIKLIEIFSRLVSCVLAISSHLR